MKIPSFIEFVNLNEEVTKLTKVKSKLGSMRNIDAATQAKWEARLPDKDARIDELIAAIKKPKELIAAITVLYNYFVVDKKKHDHEGVMKMYEPVDKYLGPVKRSYGGYRTNGVHPSKYGVLVRYKGAKFNIMVDNKSAQVKFYQYE